jgi:hypothetical protein
MTAGQHPGVDVRVLRRRVMAGARSKSVTISTRPDGLIQWTCTTSSAMRLVTWRTRTTFSVWTGTCTRRSTLPFTSGLFTLPMIVRPSAVS